MTAAEQRPGPAMTGDTVGGTRTGAVTSTTVTVKVHAELLLAGSVAVQVTRVGFWLRLKVDPLAGTQTTVATAQLSLAVGAAQVAGAEQEPGLALSVTLAGQVMEGGCVSVTVTVKLQLPTLPAPSVAEQLTGCVPTVKEDPLAGLQVALRPTLQLSVTVGAV